MAERGWIARASWLVGLALTGWVVASSAAAQPTASDATWQLDTNLGRSLTQPGRIGQLTQARHYLDNEIRHEDPARYVRLDPELARLEAFDEVADAVIWTTAALTLGSLGVGIGLAAVGREEDREVAAIFFATSGAILLTGLLLQATFRPSRQDILDVFRLP